jgi:hypothetical protein
LHPDRADWLYKASELLLNGMELITLHRRDKLSKEELFERAGKLGWSTKGITDLLDVTQVYPSAGDVIAFAVREVYSPEIAEAFGQFEGVEEVIAKAKADIRATGMSEATFTKYWAAHWMLPSVMQGYEMLHRDVIAPDDLDRLMVALDIMPFWRDKLKAISYAPYTRVDVRRMHKLGILTDDDLLRAYMDLGYDKEKATGMTEFTIRYNFEPEASEMTESDTQVAKERDLTKTDILNGFRDALIEENEAKEWLGNLGYDTGEVDYYISKVLYNKERDETDSYLKYYHDAYIRGVMNHSELVDKLNALNLASKRIDYLFAIWDLERIARVTKPTKAEILTFLRKKVITATDAIEELKGLGYSDRYVGWYMATV